MKSTPIAGLFVACALAVPGCAGTAAGDGSATATGAGPGASAGPGQAPRTVAVTAADHIEAPPGYLVEQLCTPTPDAGSWVSLCVDPAGRLYTSDQRDAGLRRFTPTTEGVIDEPVDVEFSGAQGLLWFGDSLYAMRGALGEEPGGLFRISDSDGDDALDRVECLRALHGSGGEHGWHGLVPAPDGAGLLAVAGNQTTLTELVASRVPLVWGEDQLLPRLPDGGGFMTETLAPGGCVYRVSPDGQEWELLSTGYRNPYDLAVHASGDVFTVDADMEWDLNTPWYRPTRVCLVASGSDYGWRNGSGKFPPTHLDTWPPVLELGPGSPVGMTFGYGTHFPERDRGALFTGDWSYGRVYAVHLEQEGAGWSGSAELFLRGTPLPVTDMVVNPRDGALYFTTGGRDVRGGLYRVRWVGDGPDEAPAAAGGGAAAAGGGRSAMGPAAASRVARDELDALHGAARHADLDSLWTRLGAGDRFLRSSARVALEWQPVQAWQQRALEEQDPAIAIPALAALARVSGRDGPHRDADQKPDAALQAAVLGALMELDWERLDEPARRDLLRTIALSLTRLGNGSGARDQSGRGAKSAAHGLPPASRESLLAWASPRFPSGSARVDVALCELLVALQDPTLAARALPALEAAPTQEEQLDIARCLRLLGTGWTPGLRRRYADWFARAEGYRGGASFAAFVRAIRDDAVAGLAEEEREAFLDRARGDGEGGSPLQALGVALGGERTTHAWSTAELLPRLQVALGEGAAARDRARGRQLFGAVGCFACHRVDGEGGAVGPDLSGIGRRFALADVLDAVLDPSATVSDQYRRSNLRLRDGDVLTGHVVNLSGDRIDVSTDLFRPGEVVTIHETELESITPSTVSSMPEGLLDRLELDEIADLMTYLLAERESSDAK